MATINGADAYLRWAQAQQPKVNIMGGFDTLSGYVPQAPELYSAKPGFDWGGATSGGMLDWTKDAGKQLGTGGFTGAGLAPQTSFTDSLSSPEFWFGGTDAKGMRTNGALGSALTGGAALFNAFTSYGSLQEAKKQGQFAMDTGKLNINNSVAAYNDEAKLRDQRVRAQTGQGTGYTPLTGMA